MLKKILKDLIYRIKDDEVQALAAQFTYYFILSFFPFLIFLITLISYTPLTSEQALRDLAEIMPADVYRLVHKTISQIIDANRLSALSFGAAATLWAATNGVVGVITGLNKAYDVHESRSFIKVRVISVIFTLLLASLMILSMVTLILGEVIGLYFFRHLGLRGSFTEIWNILRYLVSLPAIFIIVLISYRFLPARKLCFKELLPGTVFSTLSLIATSVLFSLYVKHYANFSYMYGSLGGIIILLLWLYYTSLMLLLGGEINAAAAFYKERHGGKKTAVGKK